MKIKAVIFDLDGTITEPYLDFDRIKKEIGLSPGCGPLLEEMEKMLPHERKRAEEILDKYEQLAIEHSRLNIGARETLDKLRKMGIQIGVMTRNTRSNAWAVAKKHNIEFDSIVDRNDGPVKPNPFSVIRLCEFFKVKPQQTLVVGDYLFDLQSAKAAGAKAVLIKTGKNAEQFIPFADYIIDSLPQLLDIINSYEN